MCIPLNRVTPGFQNHFNQLLLGEILAVGVFVDLVGDGVGDNCAIDVIRTVPLRALGDRRRTHHPEGLDMREVIKHQTADRNHAQVELTGGRRDVLELCPRA